MTTYLVTFKLQLLNNNPPTATMTVNVRSENDVGAVARAVTLLSTLVNTVTAWEFVQCTEAVSQ